MAGLNEPMPVAAVIGAGGATGQECVKRLLDTSNHAVVAIVRDIGKAKEALPKNERLTIVEGDVTKSYTIRKALSNSDYVIFAATSSTYWGPECVDYKGVVGVARAVEELGLKRMVLISSMMVTPQNRWHPVRMVLNNMRYSLMDFKFEGEQAVRKANISYTIVRAGGLNNTAGAGKVLVAGQGDNGSVKGTISRADLAAVCVEALTNPAADRVTVEVVSGGPVEEGTQFSDLISDMWSTLKADEMPEIMSPKWVEDIDAVVMAECRTAPKLAKGGSSKGPEIVVLDTSAQPAVIEMS